jgi:hypothetical protein
VIGRAAKRAKKKKAGPISHNRLLAAIGKVVPCRKWGGWSRAGGDFERGVYGLVNARQLRLSSQQPAASALAAIQAQAPGLDLRSSSSSS